jgi:hypothetical protein
VLVRGEDRSFLDAARGSTRLPVALAFVVFLALGTTGCGRSGLFGGPPRDGGGETDGRSDMGRDLPRELPADRAADMTVPVPPPLIPGPPACEPQPETCNGVDDDCDQQTDEDIVPIPCPGGGSRYCVAARMSECPRRCEECLPGSRRVCYVSFCYFWGTQTCAADGRSFGLCREGRPPPECAQIAEEKRKSPELEQCCLDNGYCCLDDFDLDNDGDRTEMLGRCEGVVCEP